MKKNTIIIILVLLVLLLIIAVIITTVFLKKGAPLSIQDDGVCFGMSSSELIKIKGNPFEKNENAADTGFDMYTYNESLWGHSARSVYTFGKAFGGDSLTQCFFIIDNIGYTVAEECVNSAISSFKSIYAEKPGFFDNGIEKNSGVSIEVSAGTTDGAIGVSCDIRYENGQLTISIIDSK